MDYEAFFPMRLAQLRLQKGVSARDMSLSIGQSPGYINKIETRQNLPSMAGFFYICEYLQVSPRDFFDSGLEDPPKIREAAEKLNRLSGPQIEVIEAVMDLLIQGNENRIK
ncbi:helix-turn-helix domain-containing protein [uncultured Intestinimonas sp.]|uniref:helix-turn-helix domain-containing protein n=1 Tax=uncultured Intestinimonas sp. TaxID=1689265 RepID=UPI0025D5C701|nr:helix-turn-helix transcriptional regulator [uncultured Intestinimonas sp.]